MALVRPPSWVPALSWPGWNPTGKPVPAEPTARWATLAQKAPTALTVRFAARFFRPRIGIKLDRKAER
jgi:hypothetical protein